jgi:hypothetical protein
MQQGEEGIQVTSGAPSISVGDYVLIIGAKVQADPLATAAKESAPTTTRDSPARISHAPRTGHG